MGLITIVDFELKIANLSIDVEPEAGRTAEFEDFATRAPIVSCAVADSLGVVTRIPIEFVVFNAGNTFGLFMLREWRVSMNGLKTGDCDQEGNGKPPLAINCV